MRRAFGSAQTLSAGLNYKACARSIAQRAAHHLEIPPLNIQLGLTPILSLLAGILILAVPRLLNYIVAIYLIVVGLIGLFGANGMRLG